MQKSGKSSLCMISTLLAFGSTGWCQEISADALVSLPANELLGRTVTTNMYGSVCASYASSQNWVGHDLDNYSFATNLLYRHNMFSNERNHAHQIVADLGFLKFVDSTWVKHMDRFQVNLLWNSSGRKWNHSYTIVLGTQFLSTTKLDYSLEENRTIESQVGGFLNPFALDAGYGAVLSFWQGSNINFAFATLRLSGSPKASTAPSFIDARTIESDRAYYYLQYGFSLTAAINKPIGKHVQWVNNTRFFGNGLDRDHLQFDLNNMVIVKLWKHVQLRLDTRLAYNPMLNYDLQFRQEALLGFFYERNK